MDSGVGDKISLKLSQIDVESSIKSERCSDGRNNLSNQAIQVGVSGSIDIQIPSANVIDCFIVNHESTIRVLESGMSRQNRVVRFNYSGRDLGCWVNRKFKF